LPGFPGRMEGLAERAHLDILGDALGARLRPLGIVDAIDDRKAIGAIERLEEMLRGTVSCQCCRQIVRHLSVSRRLIGGVPPSVALRGLDLGKPGRVDTTSLRQAL